MFLICYYILSKNEPRVLENRSYKKKCVTIFVNLHYLAFLYQSKQQMVLNAIRFLLAV